MRSLLYNGHLRAECLENGSKLYTDDTTAHNHDAVIIPSRHCQQTVTVDNARQIDAGNVRHDRLRAGSDNNILCTKIFLAALAYYFNSFLPADGRLSLYKGDIIFIKQLLDFIAVPAHRTLLVILHFCKIKGDKISRDTKFIPVLHHGKNIGRMKQRLGGDAAPVDTDTAQLILIHHGHLHAEGRAFDGRRVAARSCPDNHQIIICCHKFVFLSFCHDFLSVIVPALQFASAPV